jgi:P-type Mg2+ transporter
MSGAVPSNGGGRAFWSMPAAALMQQFGGSPAGLSSTDAEGRLRQVGPNTLHDRPASNAAALLLRQFTSPIVLLLMVAALLSGLVHDSPDAGVILIIVVASGLLGFWQEYDAARIIDTLLAEVELRTIVLRDGRAVSIPVDEVVPGDIVELAAGSGVPADSRILESQDLFVNEATLTGEPYPVEKIAADLPPDTPLGRRTNALFMGTHVVSGTGRALVVGTGHETEFGRVSARLRARPPENEFERGVRRFGVFLMEVTLVLVVAIFAVNVYLDKPVADSFLFALALAVGLTPQLLPAIVSVTLARGAKGMAAKKVIVKRLASIENFGSMDVLCSDKTGTLTEGRARIKSALDAAGVESDRVLLYACVNASLQTGFLNPIDAALQTHCHIDLSAWRRIGEVPYDFVRKRLSVLATDGQRRILVSKGAVEAILGISGAAEIRGVRVPIADAEGEIRQRYEALSGEGFRTLGVAVRELPEAAAASADDECEMTFLGLLVLHDPVKPDARQTVGALAALGVSIKVITGDNALVAAQVARRVGLGEPVVLTARDVHETGDDALPVRAASTDVFAEIEPNQKERLLRALQKAGRVVGYLGDGINDAPALHAADVGISVQNAADVAKAAADIVLLDHDLGVLAQGVREGRKTFANTLKYVFMATSANFGNMFSMAGVSLFLPFLPLLPKQILFMNLLTDIPELTIGTDRVDADWIDRPHRWSVPFIRAFMVIFGALSSVFDYMTFAVLLWAMNAGIVEFRTGWFLESVISATLIVLVVRTRGPTLRSLPSTPLIAATCVVIGAALVLPFSPLARSFGFAGVPAPFLLVVGGIVFMYVMGAELAKRWFYRRMSP